MLPPAAFKMGFALEGNGDYPILPRLSRRLLQETVPEISLAPDAVLRPRKRGHGFISELPTFAQQLRADKCDLLVAVVDSDTSRTSERLNLLRVAKAKCEAHEIALCIAEGVAVRAVESWLLADDLALHQVFGGDRSLCRFPLPESLDDPKHTLNALVRRLTNGSEVSFSSYAGDLAGKIRLDVLREKCPQFDYLASNIVNCARQWVQSSF